MPELRDSLRELGHERRAVDAISALARSKCGRATRSRRCSARVRWPPAGPRTLSLTTSTGFPSRAPAGAGAAGNHEGWVVALLPFGRRLLVAAIEAEGGFGLSSEIQIGPRVEADLPQLFGLAKVTFAGMPGWSDDRVLEVLEHDVIFVAREKGRPTGYVALRREDGTIVVEQLFVAPGHERRGIGHQLLAYAEGYAIAERARSLRIVVEDANQQAQSFYRRSGFVPIEPELFELILPRAD